MIKYANMKHIDTTYVGCTKVKEHQLLFSAEPPHVILIPHFAWSAPAHAEIGVR